MIKVLMWVNNQFVSTLSFGTFSANYIHDLTFWSMFGILNTLKTKVYIS